MITVSEALALISTHVQHFGHEVIPLSNGNGKILAEKWYADRDLPPFNRVMMDGIAIDISIFEKGNRSFPIADIAAAGSPQKLLSDCKQCIEVMTGAILPLNTDAVIRYEDLHIQNRVATVNIDAIKNMQNIHRQGMDRKKDELLLQEGSIISASEIGVGASIGKHKIKVTKSPKIVIISTGDELVEIDKIPQAHQIRKSNVYQIKSILENWGFEAQTAHLKDDKNRIREALSTYISDFDLIILSGGVSKGKFDFVPDVLRELGVKEIFHKIRQRPGKPLWFGSNGTSTVFGLPGNPISSFLCTQKYVRYWLECCGLLQSKISYAKLSENVVFDPDLHYFLWVNLQFNSKAELIAVPQRGNGSGDLANLIEGNGFIELPAEKNQFLEGEVFSVIQM